VLKDILREQADAGVTVFVSTHQLSVAEEMADRIGIMHQGRLAAVGSHGELLAANQDNRLESIFLTLTTDKA
jgi:ABC-2 type transport system ATP-binding protein